MRTYGLKLTHKGGKSDFNPAFVYPESGEVVCSDADFMSNDSCGKGLHVALSLSGGLSYINQPDEIRLIKLTGKLLGKDTQKARYDKCEVLCVLPVQLYKDYQAKIDQLYKDYQAKVAQLDKKFIRDAIKFYKASSSKEEIKPQ